MTHVEIQLNTIGAGPGRPWRHDAGFVQHFDGDEQAVAGSVIAGSEGGGQVAVVSWRFPVCRGAHRIPGQSLRPVTQVTIDDDALQGRSQGKLTIVSPRTRCGDAGQCQKNQYVAAVCHLRMLVAQGVCRCWCGLPKALGKLRKSHSIRRPLYGCPVHRTVSTTAKDVDRRGWANLP